jgi:hypothetical protein
MGSRIDSADLHIYDTRSYSLPAFFEFWPRPSSDFWRWHTASIAIGQDGFLEIVIRPVRIVLTRSSEDTINGIVRDLRRC